MITLSTKVKLLAFVVVSALAAMHLTVNYLGVGWGSDDYRVTASLPGSGGAFVNGEVTYLGVPVGRVEDIKATPKGSELVLRIDGESAPIPRDVTVHVANRSAIGEQYVNLVPASTAGPTLADGDRLTGTAASLPPRIDELLRTSRDFVASVPTDSLNTVIDESYLLSQGTGVHLARLSETSLAYAQTAEENFLVTTGLIESSGTVLNTQLESSQSIRAFSRDLRLLSKTLATNDKQLRGLIAATPEAARQMDALIADVGQPLGVLMTNLVSTAQVFGVNSLGLEDAMIKLPEAISVGYAITGSYGIDMGLAQTYFDPLPCTSGYQDTQVRPGLDTEKGEPLNLEAGCTLSPSSGVNVRGPNAAPRLDRRLSLRVADSLDDLLGGTSAP